MSLMRVLIAGFLLAMLVPQGAAKAHDWDDHDDDLRDYDDGDEENGGVIILLQPEYQFLSGEGSCATLVVIAADAELASLEGRLETEEDIAAVRIAGSTIDMRLRPIDGQRLSGRLVGSRAPVLVVSQTYAKQHWNIAD
jgi:hypothetical protein